MKSITSVTLSLACLVAFSRGTVAATVNAGPTPTVLTALMPPDISVGSTTTVVNTALTSVSAVLGGTDSNGHTTIIVSDTDGINTAVVGASYLSQSDGECTAIDGSNQRCVISVGTGSATSLLTTTLPNAKVAFDITSTLLSAAASSRGSGGAGPNASQSKPNSAGVGYRTGLVAVVSSAILSGLSVLTV